MRIFEAQHNLPWVIEDAAVSVSIVCFAANGDRCSNASSLDGRPVRAIRSDLRDIDLAFDLRNLKALSQNRGVAFQGVKLAGKQADAEDEENEEERGFVIDAATAHAMLSAGGNPNGRPNTDVVRRYWSGDEAKGCLRDRFVIDFGPRATETEAQAYAAPFAHVDRIVRGRREANREGRAARRWWIHQRARPKMRAAIAPLDRFLVTVEVAKHRHFRWAPSDVLPSGSLVVFARTDDFFLGILESRFHKLWASETHNPLENRPRYRIGHSFESFPFPERFTPDIPLSDIMANPHAVAVADAARELYAAREAALASGRDRMNMTELYDLRIAGGAAWLTAMHRRLDEAVGALYGISPDLTDDQLLAVFGELHQTRQGATLGDSDEEENA